MWWSAAECGVCSGVRWSVGRDGVLAVLSYLLAVVLDWGQCLIADNV